MDKNAKEMCDIMFSGERVHPIKEAQTTARMCLTCVCIALVAIIVVVVTVVHFLFRMKIYDIS